MNDTLTARAHHLSNSHARSDDAVMENDVAADAAAGPVPTGGSAAAARGRVGLSRAVARWLLVLALLVLVVPLAACSTEGQQSVDGEGQDSVPAVAVDAEVEKPDIAGAAVEGADTEGGEAANAETGGGQGAESDAASGSEGSDTGTGQLEVLPSGPVVAEGEVAELPDKPHPLIGQPAPDFTMTNVATGEETSLSDFAGQPVLVNFWATWCPPCRLEMPWFENAYQQHQDDGFVVLAVDAGETNIPPDMVNDVVMRFVNSSGLTFPVLLGDNAFDVQQAYSVTGLPSTFMVGRDGTVVQWHSSAYPNQATLDARLQAILGDGAEDEG